MKSTTILVPILMSNFVVGCDDGEPPAEPVAIEITADKAPALVAYRDGLDGEWQTATRKSPTSFEAEVTGPYVIAAACEDLTTGTFTTWQFARTPDDERKVTVQCDPAAPSTHAITGHMVQAGLVQLGGERDSSTTADWDFELAAPSGTYDLMARTDDRFVLRRAISITGDHPIATDLDVDGQDGAALADVAFTVTNAAAAETVTASVSLGKAGQKSSFDIYEGPIATAKVVPDAALIESDAQSVALVATADKESRSLRRPFRVGGQTAYTLPAALTGVTWKQADGNLEVSWGTLAQPAALVVNLSGASADGSKHQNHSLDLSQRFVAATALTRATVDTRIEGYKPEWKIDLARAYDRELIVERAANGEIAMNRMSETVAP